MTDGEISRAAAIDRQVTSAEQGRILSIPKTWPDQADEIPRPPNIWHASRFEQGRLTFASPPR